MCRGKLWDKLGSRHHLFPASPGPFNVTDGCELIANADAALSFSTKALLRECIVSCASCTIRADGAERSQGDRLRQNWKEIDPSRGVKAFKHQFRTAGTARSISHKGA